MNYATDYAARKDMIWCALTAASGHIKDPAKYVNQKEKKFGPMLRDAVAAAHEVVPNYCLAVCVDMIDTKLSAANGWSAMR